MWYMNMCTLWRKKLPICSKKSAKCNNIHNNFQMLRKPQIETAFLWIKCLKCRNCWSRNLTCWSGSAENWLPFSFVPSRLLASPDSSKLVRVFWNWNRLLFRVVPNRSWDFPTRREHFRGRSVLGGRRIFRRELLTNERLNYQLFYYND